MSDELLDCLGRRRSPAATSAFHAGRTPRNAGLRYRADPPSAEEIVAVMRAAGPGRLRRPAARHHRRAVARRAANRRSARAR